MADLSYTGVPVTTGKNTFSTRGVGYEWQQTTAADMSVLFGAGGQEDGNATAIIGTTRNKQIEDALTLQGMGVDGAIDQGVNYISTANKNNEFNFSNFKTGALPNSEIEMRGQKEVYLNTTVDGLAGGDTVIDTDPRTATLDIHAANLGILFADAFDANTPIMPNNESMALNSEQNPFIGYNTYSTEARMDEAADHFVTNTDNTLSGTSQTKARQYGYEGVQGKIPMNLNESTGLRKINTKRNQGQLMEQLITKSDFMNMYHTQSKLNADRSSEIMGESVISIEGREKALAGTRTNLSSYLATQTGLNHLSSNTANKYRKTNKKSPGQSMLSNTIVGV